MFGLADLKSTEAKDKQDSPTPSSLISNQKEIRISGNRSRNSVLPTSTFCEVRRETQCDTEVKPCQTVLETGWITSRKYPVVRTLTSLVIVLFDY